MCVVIVFCSSKNKILKLIKKRIIDFLPFRDNSGIHISPSNHIFDTLQSPSSTTGYSSNPYSMGPATAIPLATYRGPVPLSMDGGVGGMATNSIFSEAINSHTSTPIHGTMASTSLFGSEEQTSVTTQLPNFPRANLQVCGVYL